MDWWYQYALLYQDSKGMSRLDTPWNIWDLQN